MIGVALLVAHPRRRRRRRSALGFLLGAAVRRRRARAALWVPSARARRASTDSRLRPRDRSGSPALFAVVYTLLASAIYFSLGVVADHALGLTPFVFLAGGLFFVLRR